ncbi:hypothetical protein [Actinoplanes sp. URMC 104]|uniref:hypothetical protein n=1 Tax=Actinoplanes sp. URMC 104 TaxID=3423409 RepID=UPI003F1B2248
MGSRLYVMRDEAAIVVSRERLPMSGTRLVQRSWQALVETTVPSVSKAVEERRSPSGAAIFIVPSLIAGGVVAAFAPIEFGLLMSAVTFFGAAYAEPVVRRRRNARNDRRPRPAPSGAHILTASDERATFDRSVALADAISDTWPHLGRLIDVNQAQSMLADALWEISGVLARRQKLAAVLAQLSRPDFAAQSPADGTALEVQAQRDATERALADLQAELSHREASLRRAEQAGRNFTREEEMRRAIRAARESLQPTDPEQSAAALPPSDPGADLAEQTRTVLDAYRELTADFHPDPPP